MTFVYVMPVAPVLASQNSNGKKITPLPSLGQENKSKAGTT